MLAWSEGMPQWMPLSGISAFADLTYNTASRPGLSARPTPSHNGSHQAAGRAMASTAPPAPFSPSRRPQPPVAHPISSGLSQGYAQQNRAASAAGSYPRAPLWGRIFASLLDGLVVSAALLPGGVVLLIASAAESESMLSLGVLLLLPGLVWGLWYSFAKDGNDKGQSIGKRNNDVMVVHLPTNQPCSRGQSSTRQFVTIVMGLIPFGQIIEFVCLIMDERGRRLADKAADTQVIRVADYVP